MPLLDSGGAVFFVQARSSHARLTDPGAAPLSAEAAQSERAAA